LLPGRRKPRDPEAVPETQTGTAEAGGRGLRAFSGAGGGSGGAFRRVKVAARRSRHDPGAP